MLLCHCVGRNVLTSLLTDAANGHCLCVCVCKCRFAHAMIYLEVKGQCIGRCLFVFLILFFKAGSLLFLLLQGLIHTPPDCLH